MEGQQHLGGVALDAFAITANYRFGQGWDVVVTSRPNGGTFADHPRRIYDYLTTDELADVLGEELVRLLG